MDQIRIVGFAGSLRRASFNRGPKLRTAVRELVVALRAWTLRIAIRDEAA